MTTSVSGAGLSVSVTSGEKYTVRDLGRDIVGGLEIVGSWF